MQIGTVDPTQLRLTDRALEHIRLQLKKENARALVLNIVETGCNGFMYELNYATELAKQRDMKTFHFDNEVTVYVATEHWSILQGTEIDFVTEGLNYTLQFKNPNADTLCGCGESFSISGT